MSHLGLALAFVIVLVSRWGYAGILIYEVVVLGVFVGEHEVVLLLLWHDLLPVEILLVGGLGDEVVVLLVRVGALG